jgi:hypothetical protein
MSEYLRTKFHCKQLLLLIFSTVLAAGLVYNLEATNPTAVVLLYFRGTGVANGIFLEWETATEFGTAGFMLERAGSANGPFAPLLEIGLIPAEGDGITGAKYEATDTTAVAGQTYWYILVEHETDGGINKTEPLEVQAGQTPTSTPTPTNTPVPTNTPTPTATTSAGSSPPPTSTPTATRTPTATAVPTTAVTATPTSTTSPTAVPSPTVTPGQTPLAAGPPAPQITPTATAVSQPPTIVPETGYPPPEISLPGEGAASDQLALEPPGAVDTASEAIEQTLTPTPAVNIADLTVIGSSEQPISPAIDIVEASPSIFNDGLFDGRNVLWFALGSVLLLLMAGMTGFAYRYYGRRHEGSDRW